MPPAPADPASAVLAAAVEPVLVADAAGRCLGANPAALALLGRTLDELRGREVADLVDDAAAAGSAAATRGRFLAGAGWAAELDLRRPDGTPVPVEAFAAPLAAGGEVRYAVFLRDAARRRADRDAERERDADFRAAFEDAAVGAALVGLDGRFLRTNPALRALLGYAGGELPGRSFRDVTHPDDLGVGEDQVRRLRAGEIDGCRVEKRYVRQDGGVVWAHLGLALVRDAAGAPRYVVAQVQDVTAERAAADALRANEARFRAVWEATADAVALSDPEGVVLAANPAYLALYGLTEDEVVGRSFAVIFPAEQRAWAEAQYRAAFADPAPPTAYGARIRRKDGEERDVEARAGFVAVDGVRVALVSAVRDVTERAAAAAALGSALAAAEEGNRIKDRFLSTMSHELRTPLTAIIGYGELLRDELAAAGMAGAAADAAQVLGSAGHLLALVNDVLDVSLLDAGQLGLRAEPVDLAALVGEVAAELAPLAAAKRVALAAAAPAGLSVVADRRRLRQVLLNLAGNAVKFTEAGSIAIVAKAAAGAVEVEVRDTGIGIAAGVLPRVFEEFRQADGSTTRKYGGTGLGLAIVRRLVELHGGTVRAESEPGVGSTFTVTLPAG